MPHQTSAWTSPATLAAKIRMREQKQAAQVANDCFRKEAMKCAELASAFQKKNDSRYTIIYYNAAINELNKISERNDNDKKLLIDYWMQISICHNKYYDQNKVLSIKGEILAKTNILSLLSQITPIDHAKMMDINDDISTLYELRVFQSQGYSTKRDYYLQAIEYTLYAAEIGIANGADKTQLCYFLDKIVNLRSALQTTLKNPSFELSKQHLDKTKLLNIKIQELEKTTPSVPPPKI